MRKWTHLVVGFTMVLALVSASCGETASGPGGVPSELQTVDEFMSRADPEAEYRAFVGLGNRFEGMLVECMAEQGLEYAAREADPGSRPLLGEGLSDSEFMLEYGYGVFTAMFDEARWTSEHPPDEQGADPDVLWGEFTDDLEAYMVVLDECSVRVEEKLGRPDPGFVEALSASLDEAWDPIGSELEDIPQRIERDSRYVEAEKAWSACMADNGYDFATEEDIENYLMSRRDEFEEDANLGTLVLTAAFVKDLQPFIDEELAIAAADLACRAALDRVREELQPEYEGLFIDKHRDQLEKIRELDQQLMEVIMEGWQW